MNESISPREITAEQRMNRMEEKRSNQEEERKKRTYMSRSNKQQTIMNIYERTIWLISNNIRG